MNIILDKCILFLFGMLSLLLTDFNYIFVIACFTTVILSSFSYTFRSRQAHLLFLTGTFLFSCLTLLHPEFCFFLPLLYYDLLPSEWMTFEKNSRFRLTVPSPEFTEKLTLLLTLLIGIVSVSGILHSIFKTSFLWFPLFGCLLSLLLRLRTEAYASLSHRYRKTRDDDTELQILLKERNQTLLEKQDSEIYAATLRERNRIAREIHDNVGHMLTRSILMVGALRAVHKEGPLSQPLDQLNDTLNQAMTSIRQSVHDLHDSSVNLKESLETLIREFSFCPVKLRYEMSPELPRELKYSFISIAKEALVNISKHSNADAASITALEHPGFYQFIIEDNGQRSKTLSDEKQSDLNHSFYDNGIGLINMQNRVKALHGTMQLRTEKGFCIHITIPKS